MLLLPLLKLLALTVLLETQMTTQTMLVTTTVPRAFITTMSTVVAQQISHQLLRQSALISCCLDVETISCIH